MEDIQNGCLLLGKGVFPGGREKIVDNVDKSVYNSKTEKKGQF